MDEANQQVPRAYHTPIRMTKENDKEVDKLHLKLMVVTNPNNYYPTI